MAVRERVRLPPSAFRLPVEKLREGYYSDAYFTFTKQLLEADDHHPRVVMQVFQRKESILGGIDEAIAILKLCSGHYEGDLWVNGWDGLDVKALHEGDEIAPWGTVMTVEGGYWEFAHLETVYLGVMARRTLIMRNVREVVEAANGKPILYFPARHDHWLVQTGDGWSAHIGGSIGVSTDAQASWWGGRGVRTVPHALISAYGGGPGGAPRRPGPVVGRPRRRHGPARADQRLRRGHGARRAQVRRPLRARHERHRARRLRQRLGSHRARGRRGARRRPLGRAPGHLRPARRRVAAADPR